MATSPNKKDKKDNEVPAAASTDEAADVKRKLAWRMGLAGLMIVGLLGALALFDRLSAPDESEATAPQFTEPVPVAKKVITQPVTPAEPTPEPAKPEPPAAPAPAPEASAAPVDKTAPRSDRPPRPEVAAQPTLPRAPAVGTAPAGRTATPAPAAPAPSAKAAAAAPARAEPPAARSEAPMTGETLAPPRLFSGYALQAGVFADPRRAEDLQARLVLEGIPATIESRVQVGPFKNRAEAEAMREKLKALGVDSVLLPPRGARH